MSARIKNILKIVLFFAVVLVLVYFIWSYVRLGKDRPELAEVRGGSYLSRSGSVYLVWDEMSGGGDNFKLYVDSMRQNVISCDYDSEDLYLNIGTEEREYSFLFISRDTVYCKTLNTYLYREC